jgi:hypothetical protein
MSKQRSWIAAALLFLPVIALAMMVYCNYADKAKARIWTMDIEGYDPRDLMYGHYLMFRFADRYGVDYNACKGDYENCCVCLGTDAKQAVAAKAMECKAAKLQCPEAHPRLPKFLSMTRYYVPEDAAKDLEGVLRQTWIPQEYDEKTGKLLPPKRPKDQPIARIDVHVTPRGNLYLGDLTVNGMPWRHYLVEHPTKPPEALDTPDLKRSVVAPK